MSAFGSHLTPSSMLSQWLQKYKTWMQYLVSNNKLKYEHILKQLFNKVRSFNFGDEVVFCFHILILPREGMSIQFVKKNNSIFN